MHARHESQRRRARRARQRVNQRTPTRVTLGGERPGTSKFSAVPPRSHTADAMAPKKAPAAAEPEPEPEAEVPPEPEEGEGIFYFPDNSKYGAPSTACTRMAAALCSGWCLCAHCTPAPALQRACG